ncbi:MAG: DUF1998 domain-containing protein [Candidatus Krumholzibacteria bacterium]|nr:DUF1998 domain-containing protein [Candidatus Krumholzibacteria bacterium]
MEKLPDAWLELKDSRRVVRKSQRQYLPLKLFISSGGVEDEGQQKAWWLPTPFRFCLHCGVAYDAHQQSDFGKLATLGSEGRSTATTVMSLSTVNKLRTDKELDKEARKLLSFTDNRQDASLQAGHFNDFVEITLLRSALWRAVDSAVEDGLRHDNLTLHVFKALNLSLDNYAIRPDVKYAGREETERALREVLGYYLHRDLRRGWRVTLPNLEQCGLLLINYLSLHEFCADDSEWENCHSALVTASTRDREKVCHALLDYMRRELAIRVSYLDPIQQESIRQLSRQRLIPPWAFDEEEGLEQARTVFPRSRGDDRGDLRNIVYLSPRGGFGLYLKRPGTFPQYDDRLITDDVARIIPELCERLTVPGILHQGSEPLKDNDVPGYQLNASAMIWRAGRGERAYHDPIRVPREPGEGLRTNPFFTEFYRSETEDIKLINAHEHTAQVPSDIREVREEQFREATLPIMYCSPTMELGVDIAQLNVVNMRNVPPTPANYAQRSGRAGRSGQPAFVFTYCSSGSPHDQYFFKRPELMVAGSVSTPRIDLSNEDLLKAHVHAIWLQTANLSLGNSLQDVLDVSGDEPTLDILPRVQEVLNNQGIRDRARVVAQSALGEAIVDLVEPGGDSDKWLDDVLIQLPQSFEHSSRRWRGLYRSALNQSKRQQKIILNPSRDPKDRKIARRLRAEAESQLRLLLDVDDSQHSDFYSYRCFASEGFLPGYNFPRLPLSAFLPGQRRVKGNDDFLTRPRFLAISEFGPRSIIYHEGSRFTVNKVILPMGIDEEGLTRRGVRCSDCGYIHPLGDEPGPDLCENCASKLPLPYENLFRMQNVATRRRDRINSDEEERFRLGYEIISGIRFAQRGNKLSALQAELIDNDNVPIALLMYGSAATVWRLNLGWRRRRDKDQLGYVIDVERGFWARNQAVDDDPDDPMSPQTLRVIPYVEDTRNCLLINPLGKYDPATMASLEAALKVAIQAVFQLEDRELATEPLPSASERKLILLYEATEGGAGVLKRLVQDPIALNSVAREALELCHFDPDTFQDCGRAPGAREICDAACYDCLLSYYNQRDHRLLDRKLLPDLLRLWTQAKVKTSPAPLSRDEQVARLIRLCQSELEQRWVRLIDAMGLRLPSDAQVLIQECGVRPDFLYRREGVAIFIDGPPHDSDEMRNKDAADREKLVNAGFLVIRFHHADKWELLFHRYPSVFGQPAESQS